MRFSRPTAEPWSVHADDDVQRRRQHAVLHSIRLVTSDGVASLNLIVGCTERGMEPSAVVFVELVAVGGD